MLLTLSISNSKCNIYIINNAKLNKLLNIIYNNHNDNHNVIIIINIIVIILIDNSTSYFIKFKLLDLAPH